MARLRGKGNAAVSIFVFCSLQFFVCVVRCSAYHKLITNVYLSQSISHIFLVIYLSQSIMSITLVIILSQPIVSYQGHRTITIFHFIYFILFAVLFYGRWASRLRMHCLCLPFSMRLYVCTLINVPLYVCPYVCILTDVSVSVPASVSVRSYMCLRDYTCVCVIIHVSA